MTDIKAFQEAMKKLRDLESQFRHIQNIDARTMLWEKYTDIKNDLEEVYEETYELHKGHKNMLEKISKAQDSLESALPILNETARNLS